MWTNTSCLFYTYHLLPQMILYLFLDNWTVNVFAFSVPCSKSLGSVRSKSVRLHWIRRYTILHINTVDECRSLVPNPLIDWPGPTCQNRQENSWTLFRFLTFPSWSRTNSLTLFSAKMKIEKKWAVFVSIGLLSISWVPWLQKKTMEISEQSGDLPTTQTVPGYRRMNISAHGSRNVVFTETNSHWKTLFISSLVKMLLTIPVSIATYYFISEGAKFGDAFNQYREGWYSDYWDLSKRHSDLFIINILTTICGYVIGVFACRTCIDRGSFILPLSLATPMAAVILMIEKSCTLEMFMGSQESDKVCTTEMDQTEIFTIAAIVCFALSQCLSTGLLSFKGSIIVLEKETKVRKET